MEQLRKTFFIASLVILAIAFLAELGSGLLLPTVKGGAIEAARTNAPTPGFGIPYLALLDVLLVFTMSLIALGIWLPERVHGRVQGIATLIVSILVLLASIRAIFKAFIALVIMVTLLLSPIFGTAAYFVIYASFNRGGAELTLGWAMFLKLLFAVFLVLGHQRFLQSKSLVVLILVSLLATFVVQFLIDFPPGVLVSITDALAGLIVAIITLVMAIFYLIFSIVSVIRVLRLDRAAA